MLEQGNSDEESLNTSMKTLLEKQSFHFHHPSSNFVSYALVTLKIKISNVKRFTAFPVLE